jgi:hypothetical protein
MEAGNKVSKMKIPLFEEGEAQINWEKKYQELLEWVDRGESNLMEWIKDEEPETEAGEIHLILDYGRKRKKKGRKNSLWESSERRKAKSKPDCCIRIEYRVPKDIPTLESEGFDNEDIESFPKRAALRPRVISWMKDKGHDGPIRKLVHTVEKKVLGQANRMVQIPMPLTPLSSAYNSPPCQGPFPYTILNLSTATNSASTVPTRTIADSTPCFQLKFAKPSSGSASGRELIKVFGVNLDEGLQLFWNETAIDFVLKSDQEMWFASQPGRAGTAARITVEQAGCSLHLPFNYANHSLDGNPLHSRLALVEEKLKNMERARILQPSMSSDDPTLAQQLQECLQQTAGIRGELKSPKKEIPWVVESEVERNVAVSLASLSETFEQPEVVTFVNETIDSNGKKFKRDLQPVANFAVHKIKLLCKHCRCVICADCVEDLRFLRKDQQLALWSVFGRKWESLSRKNVTNIKDSIITFAVNCRICDEQVAVEEIRSNTQTRLQFLCSQILFQYKDGQIIGGNSFDSIRRRTNEIIELEPTNAPQRVTLPGVASLYQVTSSANLFQGSELSDLLKKFQTDRQGLPYNQHIVSTPPSYFTKQ